MKQTRLPRRLKPPATIGIFAPSGAVDPAAHARSVDYLTSLGHRVVVAPQVGSQWRYYAGTDQERLDGFHTLLADPSIDVLLQARGGYGWTRLLEHIDYDALAACDKIIVGFSDMTALSLAALARTGRITFAGPMAAVDFGNGDVSQFMESHFWPLLCGANHMIEIGDADHPYRQQVIEGPVWGGTLALLTHLVGTPFFPDIDGGILFAEDIGEEPYAIERMFFQLYHAGILGRQRAVVLADFDNCRPSANGRYPYSMAEVIESLRSLLPMPVLTGLPFGHVREKMTIPMGGPARLTILGSRYRVELQAYNV